MPTSPGDRCGFLNSHLRARDEHFRREEDRRRDDHYRQRLSPKFEDRRAHERIDDKRSWDDRFPEHGAPSDTRSARRSRSPPRRGIVTLDRRPASPRAYRLPSPRRTE